jgi:hypothetical protein
MAGLLGNFKHFGDIDKRQEVRDFKNTGIVKLPLALADGLGSLKYWL